MAETRDSGTPKNADATARFLDELRQRGSVYHAAKAAGVGRSTAYRWREADPDFAAAWDDAVESCTDELEASAYQRATHGVTESFVTKSGDVVENTRYSDTLAIFLLKGRRPEKYRDRLDAKLGADESFAAALKAARERARE